jgi:Tfp pilus assembly protein FimT
MLIIGILAAVSTPRFMGALSHYRAEGAARRIKADLEFARKQAKATGKEVTVTFTVATNSYQLTGVADLDHPDQIYAVDLSETGNSAALVSADFDAEPSLTFDIHGRPVAGSPPAPLSAGTVVVAAGNHQRSVVVSPVTGKASIP